MTKSEYSTDQYGHIYRWRETPNGLHSISVANFQQYGSRVEANRLIDKANTANELLQALELMILYKNAGPVAKENAEIIAISAIRKARGEA